MTTATRPALPTLPDALAAFRRTLRTAAEPVFRGPNPHTTAWTALPDTREGKAALAALAEECGPRVTLRQPVPHLCYGPDCGLVGRVLGCATTTWSVVTVAWACGRHDWLQTSALRLLDPGTAWEAENADIGAHLRARLAEARA